MATLPTNRLDTPRVDALMISLLLVVLPHAFRIPVWAIVLVAALFSWRAYVQHHARALPSKWLMFAITLAALAGVHWSYGRILGRDSGVALLLIMLGLKLLEMTTLRDAMVLIFIGYFLIITNFLYSQTLPVALYMLAVLWLITATMIGFQFRSPSNIGYRYPLRSAAMMLVQAAPLMVMLFVLFPRMQGPLWGVPQDNGSGVTGLSNTMSPGSMSSLVLSDAVAFRVNFGHAPPSPDQLYWRGPVMWDFDGTTWHAGGNPALRDRASSGTAISYTVTLEPNGKHWLLALDVPASTPPQSFMTADYELRSMSPLTVRLRYAMTSYLNYHDNAPLNGFDRRRALRLPRGSNPRTTIFAHKLRATVADNRAYIEAVLRLFRTEHFFYTTQPPLLGTNSVDEFLFSTRAGFCEHYASSFVVLMRDAGIPARVITGYQGGELNDFGDYLIVRQSDAHAWAEVWLADTGWTRVDPTAAVSPTRIEQGIAAAVPQGAPLPLLLQSRYAWLRHARLTWDSAANTWNQLVLGYDFDRQRRFLRDVGMDATWQKLAALLITATGGLMLLLTLWILWQLRSPPVNAVMAAYARFCARLAPWGLVRLSNEGPEAFRQRTIGARPEWAQAINTISNLYIMLRYGKTASKQDESRLRKAVHKFRP